MLNKTVDTRMKYVKANSEENWKSIDSNPTGTGQGESGKMHVAFLIDSMQGGGAEISVLTIIESLLRRNYKVDLILLKFGGRRLSLIPHGVTLFVLDKQVHQVQQTNLCSIPIDEIHWKVGPTGFRETIQGLFNYLRLLKVEDSDRLPIRRRHVNWIHSISKYLQSQNPQLVIANLSHSYHISILSRKLTSTRIPIIWSIHNDDLCYLAGKNRAYFNHLIRDVDRLHAVSQGLADSVTKYLDSLNLSTVHPKVTTIYNGFDANRILSLAKSPVEHDWFRSAGSRLPRDNSKMILAVGRLCSQKNFELLIYAFSTVLEQIDARLLILGEGERRRKLEYIVEEMNITHAVSMPGWVDNPYSYMAKADLLVSSSDNEGMPMVLGEALICGCPIVSTDCPSGPREYLENGRWGHLTPINDKDALAAAMLETLSNGIDRDALKSRGTDFDINNIVDEYEKLYREVISEFKSNSSPAS